MNRRIAGVVAACALSLGVLGACAPGQDASKTDIKEPELKGDVLPSDYETRSPDKLTVFQNVDLHPTIVRLCIDGVAFRTISSSHAGGMDGSVARVEEWDAYCES